MQGKISMKTMTDYHLYDFMRCPHKFYFRYIKRREPSLFEWQQIVQAIVNQIISDYYMSPAEKQTTVLVLELLERHWSKVRIGMFSSKAEYYIVLAKLTDHLLRYVKSDSGRTPPLFLYEKLQTYMEELGVHISLTFEVGEWSTQSFVIKKFVVDANEEMLALFQKLTAVFCYKAFSVLPEKIEIINLIEGTSSEYVPKQQDIMTGMSDLYRMKEILQQPEHYVERTFHSECIGCAFRNECKVDEVKDEPIQNNSIVH
ncbi:hypothetical protein QUF88_09220 [Bacillus sp. DX1.1]|uniref:hypothetical protein n=1 Tax=unclassified Bacillus (in: firmicutes) TaxID=185979 RepID=UPI00256FF3F0|nr:MULTISPECIES: hypothetical protein [unclassified Bacillus (in: firmicutes)]MDM5154003.1 hypothetical protein [Bacillus sp. DX1.1]WJE82932.1 hypothetical protein QRE67_06725 [Bacillus sp. DX3.1]